MRKKPSLSTKLLALGVGFLLIALASIGLTLWVTWQLEGGAAAVNENQALLVYGRYTSVTMRDTIVDGVDRTNTTGGACKGVSISEVDGQVTLHQPRVSRVLCTGGTADADGIAVFGRTITTSSSMVKL